MNFFSVGWSEIKIEDRACTYAERMNNLRHDNMKFNGKRCDFYGRRARVDMPKNQCKQFGNRKTSRVDFGSSADSKAPKIFYPIRWKGRSMQTRAIKVWPTRVPQLKSISTNPQSNWAHMNHSCIQMNFRELQKTRKPVTFGRHWDCFVSIGILFGIFVWRNVDNGTQSIPRIWRVRDNLCSLPPKVTQLINSFRKFQFSEAWRQ